MMKIYRASDAYTYVQNFCESSRDYANLKTDAVSEIISAVRKDGDQAIRTLAQKFGDVVPASFLITEEEIATAIESVSVENREVLERSADSIRNFAEELVAGLNPMVQKRDGYETGFQFAPVESAACYVPGGRFPLPSTALMTAIPAKAAGVKNVMIGTPDPRPEILLAGKLAGADKIYQVGGAQAVAAFVFGTESIERADMVVGPGNAYVTEAKRQLQGIVGIDMLAGPSEVAIIADKCADTRLVILDIISQSEHDPDARSWLMTDSESLASEVSEKLPEVVSGMDMPDFIGESLAAGAILLFPDIWECVAASNLLAPEHLHLNIKEPEKIRASLIHFGSIFIGNKTTVPFGDYMAGPNHTLPTGTSARFSSGLSPLTFMRTQTWTEATGDISRIATDTEMFARMEGLNGHAEAARARIMNSFSD